MRRIEMVALRGAALLTLLVAACGHPASVDHDDRIVVVRGADRPPSFVTAQPASSVNVIQSAEAADGQLSAEDPTEAASLTAARQADPYRLNGVDPEMLAEAGG